jgi:hypothetical protein
VAGAQDAVRQTLAGAEHLATRRLGAVVLFAAALVGYAIDAVAWPLTPGRDLDEYLLFSLQAFDRETVLPWAMLFRTPGTPLVVGPALELFDGALAEPVSAVLYAVSIVAWTGAARFWGPRVAVATAPILLLNPAYAAMFHEFGSELVMAAGFAVLALLVVRAAWQPTIARWVAAGAAAAFVVLVRPGNIVLLALAAVPLLARAAWRERLAATAAFTAAAILPLVVWVTHNGLRYDEWGIARGGKAVVPFYRVLLTDHLTEPDASPASGRLADAVRRELVTREPYRAYRVSTDDVFERATARVHEDMYILSDEQFGWDSDYGVLRSAALEAIERHPGAYASGVADTFWQQLSEPYYRLAPGRQPAPEPSGADAGAVPAPSEGQLIPGGQNLWISRPDQAIRQVWDSPTTFHFAFADPSLRPRFDELVRRRDDLLGRLPDRAGSTWLATRLNQLGRWYPRPVLWLALGLVAIAVRRPVQWPLLGALATSGLLVVVLNALGLPPDPHYMLPVAPAFIVFGLGGLLGVRKPGAA